MSRHYKSVKNGNGTELTISDGAYLMVGPNGTDIMLRGAGKVVAFDKWEDFVGAIDTKKATYFKDDNAQEE